MSKEKRQIEKEDLLSADSYVLKVESKLEKILLNLKKIEE